MSLHAPRRPYGLDLGRRDRLPPSALPALLGEAEGCKAGGAACDEFGAQRFTLDVVR
jgi:hypothetical protein